MLDLTKEKSLSIHEVARLLPKGRRGRPVHFSTVLRWILDGAKGPAGERIRLEAGRLGGRWFSTAEGVARFVQALTPDLDAKRPAPRSSGRREAAARKAGLKLEKLGL
jgi:hypothetical protein